LLFINFCYLFCCARHSRRTAPEYQLDPISLLCHNVGTSVLMYILLKMNGMRVTDAEAAHCCFLLPSDCFSVATVITVDCIAWVYQCDPFSLLCEYFYISRPTNILRTTNGKRIIHAAADHYCFSSTSDPFSVVTVIPGASRGYTNFTLFSNFATTLSSRNQPTLFLLLMVRELSMLQLIIIVFHQLLPLFVLSPR